MADEFRLKAGDRFPRLRMQLLDSAGAAVDLTGATVAFRMRRRGTGTATVLTGTAVVITAATGVVEFQWGAGDATTGTYDAEWVLTWVNGAQTVPTTGYVVVVVEPALG